MARFKYTGQTRTPTPDDPLNVEFRPMLQVSARGKKNFEVASLLDTGATTCLFPMSIESEIEPEYTGVHQTLNAANGSDIVIFYAKIIIGIKLGGKSYHWPATVGFTKDRDEPVLGDAGFLRYFPVTFDRPKREFMIHSPKDLPIRLIL